MKNEPPTKPFNAASEILPDGKLASPSYEEGEKKENIRLGKRLRQLRNEHRLTIRELAAQSGISANMLSLVENGKSSPSVNTLHRIAAVFQVSVADFFDEKPLTRKVIFNPCPQPAGIPLEESHFVRLSKNLEGQLMDCALVTLPPAGSSGKTDIVHTGYEFAYCLEGRLLYTVESEHYLLEKGDSIVFTSHLPHQWQNVYPTETTFLLVMANISPVFEDSYVDTHLDSS